MKYRIILLSATLIIACAFIMSGQVQAEESMRIVVSPARQEVKAQKGQISITRLTFYNEGDMSFTGKLTAVDFIVTQENGAPYFLLNGPFATRFSAAEWVSIPSQEVNIGPKMSINVPLTLNIPTNASPGGHYFAVILQSTSATNEAETAPRIYPQVAGLVNISIPGKYKEQLQIDKFSTKQHLQEYGPINIAAVLHNTGDIHVKAKPLVTANNWLGTYQTTGKELRIFPQATRNFEGTLGKKFMFGRYHLNLVVPYANGKITESSIYVWIIPWKLILIVLLVILILFLLIPRKKYYRSQKHIQ